MIPHNKGKRGWTNKGSFIKFHPDFVPNSSRKKQGQKLKGHPYWGPKKWTETRKKKMSLWMKLHNPFKGKKHTEKTKKILSKVNKRTFTLATRKKISKAHKGANSYLWKGGITAINFQIRHSFKYRLWREKVFKRDNWTCVLCGKRSKKKQSVKLNADHIKSFANYPKLRFKVFNGRTLCEDCHKKTDTYLNKKEKKC